MLVRNAHHNDCPAITDLVNELGYPTSLTEMEARLTHINSHQDYITLVAEVEGRVVGIIALTKGIFYEKNGMYVRIVIFITKRHYRNRGIGKLLLTHAEQIAADNGIKTILVNSGTRAERADAHRFYQKMGYEIKSSGFVKYV